MKIEKLQALGQYIDAATADKINEIIDHLNALEEKKPEEEWPKDGGDYFTIGGVGNVFEATWCNDYTDHSRKEFNICFRTREEAEQAAAKVKELLKNL